MIVFFSTLLSFNFPSTFPLLLYSPHTHAHTHTHTHSQLPIQEKDSGALQTIAEEIQLFQKVQHDNIVKFYGVEIHHVRNIFLRTLYSEFNS